MIHLALSAPSPEFLRFFVFGLQRLTKREMEVCQLLIEGESSKSIGIKLSISPRTVEIHRGHVFEKTGASNVIELVKMIAALNAEAGARLFEPGLPFKNARGYPGIKFLSAEKC